MPEPKNDRIRSLNVEKLLVLILAKQTTGCKSKLQSKLQKQTGNYSEEVFFIMRFMVVLIWRKNLLNYGSHYQVFLGTVLTVVFGGKILFFMPFFVIFALLCNYFALLCYYPALFCNFEVALLCNNICPIL